MTTERNSRFELLRDGRVVSLPPQTTRSGPGFRLPAGSIWVDRGSHRWMAVRSGHLVISEGPRAVWRSVGAYPVRSAQDLPDVATSPKGIAFRAEKGGPLYMAADRGPERSVRTKAFPEMWTRTGRLITLEKEVRANTLAIAVRSAAGTGLATLAAHLGTAAINASAQDERSGTFLFWNAGGDLLRTDGLHTTVLANARSLGFRSPPSTFLLSGGLIELLSPDWHEAILRPDGRLFARASVPSDGSVAGFGVQQASPDGRAVAYVLSDVPNAGSTVFALRADRPRPILLYRTEQGGADCDLPLAWHGRWLLFTPHRGEAVVIDSAGREPPIRLPARFGAGGERVEWA